MLLSRQTVNAGMESSTSVLINIKQYPFQLEINESYQKTGIIMLSKEDETTTMLRPHHAVCAQFFEGKGYSDWFTAHMHSVLASLKSTDPVVTIISECDSICAECPNQINSVCTSDEKVKEIDRRAITKMGLAFGESVRWSRLCGLAVQTIIQPGLLRDVCHDCEWIGLCAEKEHKNNDH